MFMWASLVAWMVKNPPAMRETWVQPLGWEHPLEDSLLSGLCFYNLNTLYCSKSEVQSSFVLV